MMSKLVYLFCLIAFVSSTAYAGRENLLRVPLTNQEDKSTNFCQGCRSLVSYMTRFNVTSQRQESKKIIKDFCETMYPPSTESQKGPCPIFVEGTFFIIDKIDPVTHCDEIGACGPHETNAATQQVAKVEENSIKTPVEDGICDICEQMITQVQAQLDNPRFVDMIKRQVTSFCDYLAIINEDKECRQTLEGYIDESIDFIREIEPLKACQSVRVCSANLSTSQRKPIQVPSLANYQGFGIETKVVVGDQVVKDLSAPRRLDGRRNPNCMFCKTIVKEMFKFLKENRTEESIRNGLDKICVLVYGKNQDKLEQCESLVATYSKELVQMLVDETDPELICIMIEQCTYQTLISNKSSEMIDNQEDEKEEKPTDLNMFISMLDSSIPLGSIGTCVECKLFITYLRNEIQNPQSVDHVKQWLLTNLCDSLEEKKAKDSCVNMVNTYAVTFFKAVATEMDPKKACIELKACTQRIRFQSLTPLHNRPTIAQYIKPKTNEIVKNPTPVLNTTYCDQCVQIVTQIDEYLSSHPIDHDVSVLVDEVCNKLPNESAKSECAVMVKIFGQDIAQAISTMDNPKQLCSQIMLC